MENIHELKNEIQKLKLEKEVLKMRLEEAKSVIEYYADPKSWSYPGNDFHDFQIAKEDISECVWTSKKGNLARGRKAGKRARAFLEKNKA